MIYLLLEGNRIMDICEAPPCPDGYVHVHISVYPNDLMARYYRLVDGKFVRDEYLYQEYLASLEGADA